MNRKWTIQGATLLCAFVTCAAALAGASENADLVLTGGTVWTGTGRPAEAVAVRDDRILAVGASGGIEALTGPETRVIELDGAFALPGFIDSHTHFERAGELLLGINLLDVADADSLVERLRAARDRMPPGAWIVGGDWGAYAAWAKGDTGREAKASADPFSPARSLVDPITPDTPVLLSRWDREAWLANARALEVSGADCDWEGVECTDGAATGRLSASAAERVRGHVPPKSRRQRDREAHLAMQRLAENGVTTIHDITGPDQLALFQALADSGNLTVRVYARPTLDKWDELAAIGQQHGFGNEWLKIGGLKGFMDGIMGNSSARFYQPYLTSGERGRWREMATPLEKIREMIVGADASGHSPQVHAIGDEAIDVLIGMFAHAMEINGPRDRRFRMIHTQVLRDGEVATRMARLGIIAEMQPYHAIDDMRWMEERIGERARWAYAFKTLHEAGVRLSFGSDWPGTNASWYPASPVLGIYAAVTRQTLEGTPEGGWFPQERIDVETALKAYTVNNAWAAGEEELKGTLEAGKLADITVLDGNPLTLPPAKLKDMTVRYTIVGGRVVYQP